MLPSIANSVKGAFAATKRAFRMPAASSLLLLGIVPVSTVHAETAPDHPLQACLSALADTSKPAITCAYWALLSDEERGDIRRLTRDVVQDASCKIDINIDRARVAPALDNTDSEFQAPPQPVACKIKTASTVIPITATFAPHVTFKAGEAVDGTPGLANVAGVNAYLAWPVIQYVNRSSGIRRDMLAMINAYKAARRSQ